MNQRTRNITLDRSKLKSIELESLSTNLFPKRARAYITPDGQLGAIQEKYTHVILLPKWVAYFEGTNADLFFYLSDIARNLKKLTALGVQCVVLDWESDILQPHTHAKEWPDYLEDEGLEEDPRFHLSHVKAINFLRKANWRHVVNFVHSAVPGMRSYEDDKFHFHDAASYLKRENFPFAKGHIIDGLLLPDNPCANLCASREQRCLPTAAAMQALLDYTDMLLVEIRGEKLAQLQQEVAARKEARASYRASQTKLIAEVVDVGCGIFKRRKVVTRRVPFEPLFPQEAHGTKRKSMAPSPSGRYRLRNRRRVDVDAFGNEAADFASTAAALRSGQR